MGLGAGVVPAVVAVCMVGVPLLVAGPLVALVVLGWQAAALVACRRAVGRVPAVVAFVAAGLVCGVGWQLAGLVGVVVLPVVAAVFLLGVWEAAGRGADWIMTRGPVVARDAFRRASAGVARMRRRPEPDFLPVPTTAAVVDGPERAAFLDGVLWIDAEWWDAHQLPAGPAQLEALEMVGRVLPDWQRQAFTRAALAALHEGRRIEVRALSAGGVS